MVNSRLKFRAFIKSLKWIVPVELIDFVYECVRVNTGAGTDAEYDFDEVELMQYTGLKDKNGKEIYEGDIAKSGKRLFVAKWNNDIASFVWEPLDGESSYPCFNVGTVKNVEIVGNIYENPELLEGEE